MPGRRLIARSRSVCGVRLILASQSPARLETLRRAGVEPEVIVSGVDEEAVPAQPAAALALDLAHRKVTAVAARTPQSEGPEILLGCDSVLELDGQTYGKPADPDEAVRRWLTMSGRSGVLHTGHHVIRRDGAGTAEVGRTGSTTVHFAAVTRAEIEAYVATGEPLVVAGAFTIDGLGGAFVTGIEGDHHNVVGLSLPLLRTLLGELDVAWPALWSASSLPS